MKDRDLNIRVVAINNLNVVIRIIQFFGRRRIHICRFLVEENEINKEEVTIDIKANVDMEKDAINFKAQLERFVEIVQVNMN